MADSDPVAPAGPPAPAFAVHIHRGNRALDEAPAAEPSAGVDAPSTRRSPAAQRKARTRRRAGWGLAGLIGLALIALGLAWWIGQPPRGVLARVNGEYITTPQVDREILLNRAISALANNGQGINETRTATMERLISELIQAQAAHRAGAQVTDVDVRAAIASLIAREGWTPAQLEAALTRQDLSWADLQASLQNSVLINRYIRTVITQGVTDPVQASALEKTWRAQVESTSKVERYGSPDGGTAPSVGREAPDFTLRDLDGQAHQLTELRGRPVLINFWATWCAPCRLEMPTLVSRYQQSQAAPSGGAGLEILAVAINSTPDTVMAFRKEFGLRFPVLLDTDSQILNRYQVGAIPTSYLVDRAGTVRWIQVGVWTDALLREKLGLIP